MCSYSKRQPIIPVKAVKKYNFDYININEKSPENKKNLINNVTFANIPLNDQTENQDIEYIDENIGTSKITRNKQFKSLKEYRNKPIFYLSNNADKNLVIKQALRIIKKKSIVDFRLQKKNLVRKTYRKHLISKTYYSWLRPPANDFIIKFSSISQDTSQTPKFEKILLYGKYKATPDNRPSFCPIQAYKHATHLDNGSRIFPKKDINPLIQKKCICEFFPIRKSPLQHLYNRLK
ncbi:hypothetical protein QEN19_003295 [Hanseniaspora menglaensis]